MFVRRWGLLALAAGIAALLVAPQRAWAAEKDAKVDINSASTKDLETLPGVGSATAKKIIAGRPYSSVADLAKAGVPASTIEKITPLVTIGPAPVAPATASAPPHKATGKASTKEEPKAAPAAVDLNTASEKDLEGLPGVGPATAKKIIAGRPYSSAADLAKAGVPAGTIQKITPLTTVSAGAAAPTASAPAQAAPVSTPATLAPAAAKASHAAVAAAPAAQTPPQPGMVWVNLESKVFHREGDRWYGKTKRGKFMTEADALAAGYHESKEGAAKKP
jgi:DNA uptake protein ComE-like DNA-binding protein